MADDSQAVSPEERASKGGRARAESLTPEERKSIAVQAAEARWGKLPVAEYSGVLKIGNMEIACAVLGDGTRVLTQAELLVALGRHRKANVRNVEGEENVPPVLQGERLKPFIPRELLEKSQPVRFRTLQGAQASGYRAEILPKICEVYLNADEAGVLGKQQKHIAAQANILIRGLATVGIVALVDEATGYQKAREERALSEILEKFISKELKKWVRRFPFEYYEEMFRLKGWDTSDLTPNSPKPVEVGKITDDLIYKRLAPGVRQELKKLTPRNPKGYLVSKLHQHLTDEIGNPKLEKHISNVLTVMKLSDDWSTFMKNVNKVLPQYGKNFELQLSD